MVKGCQPVENQDAAANGLQAPWPVVYDPHLVLVSHRDCDRLHPDGNGMVVNEPARGHGQNLEPIVGGVDGVEFGSRRRQSERTYLPTLESHERAQPPCRIRSEEWEISDRLQRIRNVAGRY